MKSFVLGMVSKLKEEGNWKLGGRWWDVGVHHGTQLMEVTELQSSAQQVANAQSRVRMHWRLGGEVIGGVCHWIECRQ